MTDRIRLRGVRAHGRHGFGYELERTQPFDVDADLIADLSPAAASDDLAKTMDYSLVVQEIRRVIEEESFSLIESLAETIASRLLGFGPQGVWVRVRKPGAAVMLGVEEVAAEVERWAT